MNNWRIVEHEPRWEVAQLPVNAAGDTKPGFMCVHELENGNGQCGGNVFSLDQAIGTHACVVHSDALEQVPSHPLDQRDIERLEAELALTQAERDQHKRHYDEVLAQMKGAAGAKAALRASDNARRQLSKELAGAEAAFAANFVRLIDTQRELAEMREELRRDEARSEEVIGELNEQLIRALRNECGALCTDMERDRDEWERRATDSAELAKATREKLREAHNELLEVTDHLSAVTDHLRDRERTIGALRHLLIQHGVQCVGCTTETFDGAPGWVKLNADATCPVHGEYGKLRE